MPKLNQIIAIEKGAKTNAEKTLTAVHHQFEKPAPLSGLSRVYTAFDADDREKLPPEVSNVQVRAKDEIKRVTSALSDLFDTTAGKEWSNTLAKADVKVGDTVLLTGVPVGYLLFLEKQLVNIATFIRKLPVLDPADKWTWDSARGCYVSEPTTQNRTRKVMRNHLKAEATDKHPAQVETYTEDQVIGTWKITKYSGALEKDVVDDLIVRVEALQKSVKMAREEANSSDATVQNPARPIFDYLFAQATR